MPKTCVVPKCRANYRQKYTPVFSFPREEDRRQIWLKRIPRENLKITKHCGVCINHFPEEQISRVIKLTRPDGSELVFPRKKLNLTQDAVPSIFPDLPQYLTSLPGPSRRAPEVRREEINIRQEEAFEEWLRKDTFSTLVEVMENRHRFNHSNWILKKPNTKVYFMKIDFTECPAIRSVVMLDDKLNVSVMCDNVNIDLKNFEYILGSELLCDTYSKLENLLTSVYNFEARNISINEKVNYIQDMLSEMTEQSEEDNMKLGFKFISEQLRLLVSKQLRYSTDLLLTAASLYFTFPAAYKFLRELKLIILPHHSYLRTFSLSSIDGSFSSPLKVYLETKCQALEPHEKTITLMLDEIYVKPKITYKGNKVVGMASNTQEIESASTVQTFMIKSILSHNKDVVALLPVKNLDSEFLFQSTLKILKLLTEVGFEVVCIIADANKVNVKCFQKLSNDNKVKSFIVNPFDSEKIIYLLFDPVHILKNLRNNWLNENCNTFIYPSFDDVFEIKQCKFQHVRELYNLEKQSVIKHAPGLSFKVCFPNSIERQNVRLVVPLFEDKTIAAMSALGVEAEGTKEWLQIMRNWWLIVNVKHPEKGKRLREEFAKPIRCMDQENVKYLQIFCNWLKNWNDIVILDSPRGCGKLSRETYGALLHSTETLVKLCEYLLNVKKFQYVMLGVFQTDELEKRFSRYRIMSGCNYNVSVQQIIESERKLKVTSLLKLRSRSSVSLNVSEVIADINASTENIVTVDCFEEFDTIMAACSEIEIDDSTLEVIIFIAGYVSFKVCYKTSCLMCKQLLIIDHELDFDVPSELNYFNNLNRGGLKYPSAISTDIGINVYKIFQVLYLQKNELSCLALNNPKSLIKSLLLNVLEPLYGDQNCECGKSLLEVANNCMNIWVNILLNNYTKVRNNETIEQNQMNKKRGSKRPAVNSAKGSRKLNVFHVST